MPDDGDSKQVDFKEVVIALMFQVEVLLNCMVEKGLITREEFAKRVDQLKEKRNT